MKILLKFNNQAGWKKQAWRIFFWKSNKWAGKKVLKRRTTSDNFGSEFALCTVWDAMYSLTCNNKSCSQFSSSMCLFMENQINDQKGQNKKINKLSGEKQSDQRGQMLKISKQACSFIRYFRVPHLTCMYLETEKLLH